MQGINFNARTASIQIFLRKIFLFLLYCDYKTISSLFKIQSFTVVAFIVYKQSIDLTRLQD